ncbi:alpha/beta hydrolase [Nonomuraea sp. NPDC046570]|uniref:alpha/beta hydrolase n=1 Tax=Nonomuraea sp. NPDC046570 TaxID=3155255 RepID=UPI0033C81602
MTSPARPAIVLIHGLWLTPRSWEHWVERYTRRGYEVLAPAWPGMEIEVEALRKDPSVMDGLGVTEIAEHYATIIGRLDRRPIIVGHSFGGLVTQLLLGRGLGAAGVAIHPAPIKGVRKLPISSLRAAFPALRLSKTVTLTPEQFRYCFTNTLMEEESLVAYHRYQVPGSRRPLIQAATANLRRRAATEVDVRNGTRAPLLLIAGGADHTVPVSVVRAAYALYYKSGAVTDYHEFPGRPHFTVGVPGWERVADHAIVWAERQTS